MNALCEFIEFWLGPRQESYGERNGSLAATTLPRPLTTLYGFAGRWPNWDNRHPLQWSVPAFSHQDTLLALDKLRAEPDGKIIFLDENQGVWNCRTLIEGDDPPVWCYGDQMDEGGNWFTGEKQVSDSLSRFLTTFVLQELTLGSRMQVNDEGLSGLFRSAIGNAVPVWVKGPYVHGNEYCYYLWQDVLVGEMCGDFWFAANHQSGIKFLTDNQGAIEIIGLRLGWAWTLDIRCNGSGQLQFSLGGTREVADILDGTYEFEQLLNTFTSGVSNTGRFERNPSVHFRRKGQSGGVTSQYVMNEGLVTSLFQLGLKRMTTRNKSLEQLFAARWPL